MCLFCSLTKQQTDQGLVENQVSTMPTVHGVCRWMKPEKVLIVPRLSVQSQITVHITFYAYFNTAVCSLDVCTGLESEQCSYRFNYLYIRISFGLFCKLAYWARVLSLQAFKIHEGSFHITQSGRKFLWKHWNLNTVIFQVLQCVHYF